MGAARAALGEVIAEFEGTEEIGSGAAGFGLGAAAGGDGAEGEDDLGLFVVLDVAGLFGGEFLVLAEELLGFGRATPGEELGESDVVTGAETAGGVAGEVIDEEGLDDFGIGEDRRIGDRRRGMGSGRGTGGVFERIGAVEFEAVDGGVAVGLLLEGTGEIGGCGWCVGAVEGEHGGIVYHVPSGFVGFCTVFLEIDISGCG
ncbi:MAG: hypothetical protein KF812_12980 [Fimbriimonadaceae bacterium]|nr:hypothetical protein [Fimbriimonadaceae bacterium]